MKTTLARVMPQAMARMAANSGGAIPVVSAPALESYNRVNVPSNDQADESTAPADPPAPEKPRRRRK
jgi:hypothetical protein